MDRPAARAALLPALVVVLVLLRAGLSLLRTGPVLFADEAGYLGAARWLAGGVPLDMGDSPYYRPGYSAVLVPVLALTSSPRLAYALVLLVNALLAAALLPLLHLLLVRHLDVEPRLALGAALVGAAYPSVTALTQVAASEDLLFPLVVLWLLACGELVRRPTAGTGATAGLGAATLLAVHGRMVVVVALTVVLLLALRRVRPALAGLGVLVAGLLLVHLLDASVADALYAGRTGSEVTRTLSSLDGPGTVLAVLRNALGTCWYLLVASFGLVGVAVAAAVRAVRARPSAPDVVLQVLLVAALSGLVLVSATFLVDVERPDQLLYGRYAEAVVPPLLALGVVALARDRRRSAAALLGVLAVSTAVVAALRAGVDLPGALGNRWAVAALPGPTSDLRPVLLLAAGVVAVAGALAWSLAARRSPAVVPLVVLSLFVPVTAFTELRLVLVDSSSVYPAGWTSPRSAVGPAPVGYDTQALDRAGVKAYQWALPDTRMTLFDGSTTPPPASLVFSDAAWPQRHPDRPATPVWRDPGRDQVLWRLGP